MKTLYHKATVLIFSIFLLSSHGAVGGGVFAQQQELFDHTWYLEKINVNGQDYILRDYYTAEPAITEFYDELWEEDNVTYISLCDFHYIYATHTFLASNQFDLTHFDYVIFPMNCMGEDDQFYFYGNLYFPLFRYWDSVNKIYVFHNPFTYTITPINNYLQLTIENDGGNFAVYNSVHLSTNTFSKNSFTIYPNPVKETLFINKNLNEPVQASLYDLRGKMLQSTVIEASQTQIDVKQLNPGFYFVVFENETGQRESKKFVKN